MNSRRLRSSMGSPPGTRYASLPRLRMPRKVLGVDLNRSESRRWPAPQSASSQTRIAQGERLDGHVGRDAQTTHFSTLRVHVRPARSILSNALNLCRSAEKEAGDGGLLVKIPHVTAELR